MSGRVWNPELRRAFLAAVFGKKRDGISMFYVYDIVRQTDDRAITVPVFADGNFASSSDNDRIEKYGDEDIDFVDDALLNTAPHNAIEKQLLRGDVVGLALMSGAILWSAMGAFG